MVQIALILRGNIFGGPFAPTYAFHERLPRPSPGRGQAPEARTKAFHERLLRPSPGRGQAAQGGGKPTARGQAHRAGASPAPTIDGLRRPIR